MITPSEIDKRILDRKKAEIAAAEKRIDAALEHDRERGVSPTRMVFNDPILSRLVLDELRQMYSGKGKWEVELRSSANNAVYDVLEFKPYVERTFSER